MKANYEVSCCACQQLPTVGESELCGPCFYGEAACVDPREWETIE